MKLFKNPNFKTSMESKSFFVEHGGKIVFMEYDFYLKINERIKLRDKEIQKNKEECEQSKLENQKLKNELSNLKANYDKLQKQYNKFTNYQNRKGFNKDFALECYMVLVNYQNVTVQNVTVQQIYKKIATKYNLGYETTRLYVKAIKEGRIKPVTKNGKIVDMQGRLN